MPKRYHTNCIHSTAGKINNMIDQAKEITYKTFLTHFENNVELSDLFPYYAWGHGRIDGLRLKNDWAVSYHKSKYEGKECVYMTHSAIEYVFI